MPGRDAGRVDVVPDLCGDDHVVAAPEDLGQDRLAEPVVAVDRRSVEERHAGVEGGVHEPGLVVDLAPPVGRDRPRAEPDLGDDELAAPEPPVSHGAKASGVRIALVKEARPRRGRGFPGPGSRRLPAEHLRQQVRPKGQLNTITERVTSPELISSMAVLTSSSAISWETSSSSISFPSA